jgi:phosphatidate cytidylyltransferase
VTRSVFLFIFTAFAVGGLAMVAGSRRVDPRTRRERWLKFITYFAILNGVLAFAALGRMPFTVLVLLILGIGAYELGAIRYPGSGLRALVWTTYATLGVGLLMFARWATAGQVMFVYLIVALFDGFSQVSGQWLGRHQLSRRISPSKTIEGTIGGALAALLGALILRGLVPFGPGSSLAVASAIVVAALAGDLSASWVKRATGIKDFGHVLPGHGGILDRFDSLLLAAPVAFIVFILI